ncbi:MAG: methyltransferase [Candidatus Izimaplasma sp.]|nr:methyltransferase [Candidatus Izimaplasma bacterium]
MMTSRERIRKAINHEEADRVPIDFGAMRSTGIQAIAYNKLQAYLGLPTGTGKLYDIYQQLAEPEMKVLDRLHGDVVQIHHLKPSFGVPIDEWKPGTLPDGSPIMEPKTFNPIRNEKGDLELIDGDKIIARMPKGGIYFDRVHHAYAHCKTKEDIDKMPKKYITDDDLDFLEKQAKYYYENTDKAILAPFGGKIIETGESDWGFERFLMLLASEPELAHYYLNKITDVYMENLERFLGRLSRYIDVIQFGDDLGSQKNTLVSVKMYRDMIKPYHKRQYQWVQKHYPDVKVFLHSCGSVFTLIPDLIDAGVQILNPIQLSAAKMDPVVLKKEFGDDLVFWGGGIDTQQTLTHENSEHIEQEVKRLIDIFKPGGGFVFTQVHNVQANIPPEKVITAYDAAFKYGTYNKEK